jgi:hypothetical protein
MGGRTQTTTAPFEHLLINDFFEPGFYQCLLAHMKGVELGKGANVAKREFARHSLLLRGWTPVSRLCRSRLTGLREDRGTTGATVVAKCQKGWVSESPFSLPLPLAAYCVVPGGTPRAGWARRGWSTH